MRKSTLSLLAFAALSSAAMAQSPFSIGVNAINGLNGVTSITGKSLAYSLEVGYQGILGGTQIPYRASLAYARFPGSDTMDVRHFVGDDPFVTRTAQVTGVDTTLSNIQLAGDVYLPLPVPHLRMITGMSLNKWHSNNPWLTLGRDYNTPSQQTHSNGPEIKFGFRAGLSYDLTEKVACVLRYQFSALGSTYGLDDRDAAKPGVLVVDQRANLAWLDLGITYRF